MTLVLLTGASRGIGRATAVLLAERRADLILLGRKTEQLDETAELTRRLGVRVETVGCDLSSKEDLHIACDDLRARRSVPDVLINNAAIIHRSHVVETTLELWQEQLMVNLTAPFALTRALLPAMIERRSGRIVHVASISSTLGTARAAAYCASKWGLVGFMKSLAEEISDTGLMTVAVLPGSVDTRMLDGSGFTPRMTAEDVGKTIVHYAMDAPLAHNGGIVEMFGT